MAKLLVGYDGTESAKAALDPAAAGMTLSGGHAGCDQRRAHRRRRPPFRRPVLAGDEPEEHRAELAEGRDEFLAGRGIEPRTIAAIGDPGSAISARPRSATATR